MSIPDSLYQAFELDGTNWETLPEENKLAYLTRWNEVCIRFCEWCPETLMKQTMQLALERL
jgi:hypothetical protein